MSASAAGRREPDHVHDRVAAELGIDPVRLLEHLRVQIAQLAPLPRRAR